MSLHPSVAVLIGSDLRVFDQFVHRLDDLLVDALPFDAFISTDAASLTCAKEHGLLRRRYIQWVGETPDTDAAIQRAFRGKLGPNVKYHHLHQWWRLRDAWLHMEHHEQRRRRTLYADVVRLRSDLRLPRPLMLRPPLGRAFDPHLALKEDGPEAERVLVMRGDWIFWGRREAMRIALEYVDALPLMHAIGQHGYMQLPWRHMVAVGGSGLTAGLAGWLNYPKATAERPFGFGGANLVSPHAIAAHIRIHLKEFEAFEKAFVGESSLASRLPSSDLVSARDRWWRWNLVPDNEKYFLYHVLNRTLFPRAMLDLYNGGAPKTQLVTFLGNHGLLVPERHHPNCTCICPNATQLT